MVHIVNLGEIPSCPAMNAATLNCTGTEDRAFPMTLPLSFSNHENDVVRCPDSILARRSTRTNYENVSTDRKEETNLSNFPV